MGPTPQQVTQKMRGLLQAQGSSLKIERFKPHTGHPSAGVWHWEDELPWLVLKASGANHRAVEKPCSTLKRYSHSLACSQSQHRSNRLKSPWCSRWPAKTTLACPPGCTRFWVHPQPQPMRQPSHALGKASACARLQLPPPPSLYHLGRGH